MNVRDGEILGPGLLAHLRPLGVHEAGDPAVDRRPDLLGRGRVPVHEPRDPGPLPDGIDLQADHGGRGAGERGADADDDDRRRGGVHDRRPELRERRPAPPTGRSSCPRPSRSPPTSSSTTSAPTSIRTTTRSSTGPRSWGSGARPGSTSPARAPACCRRPSGATSSTRMATPTGRGLWATTSTSRSARADLQTNPLQMAVAYAAIANGGDVVRPHVGMEVEDVSGRAVQEIDPAPQRHVEIAPQHRQAILQGVHMAAQSPGGTSYSVFGDFPIPMAGKTGTAERAPQGGPVLVRRPGALSEPADRGRGHDRAGRLRRRGGGAA